MHIIIPYLQSLLNQSKSLLASQILTLLVILDLIRLKNKYNNIKISSFRLHPSFSLCKHYIPLYYSHLCLFINPIKHNNLKNNSFNLINFYNKFYIQIFTRKLYNNLSITKQASTNEVTNKNKKLVFKRIYNI